MNESLLRWVGDADALRHIKQLSIPETPVFLAQQVARQDDLYVALVGDLFDRLQDTRTSPGEWARLANAFSQFAAADRRDEMCALGVKQGEPALYAAAAFYFGGFPASAYLTMRVAKRSDFVDERSKACAELLGRPKSFETAIVKDMIAAVAAGTLDVISARADSVALEVAQALDEGPDKWVPARLLLTLVERFRETNRRFRVCGGISH